MRVAFAVAAWVVAAHLALAELLLVPDWAWHYQGGVWEARAVADGLIVLAAVGWWAPLPAGILAGAAFAQTLSHAVYGSVPNYFLRDMPGGTLAFNLPDVLLFVGVALTMLAIAYRVGVSQLAR